MRSVRVGVPLLGVLLAVLAACPRDRDPSDPPKPTPMVEVYPGAETRPTAHGNPDDADFGPDKEPINIDIRNECHHTVRLYFGHRPIRKPTVFITMNGSSQSSVPMMPGDEVWLVDEQEEPLAGVRVSRGSEAIVIDGSCAEIVAR